MKGGYGMKKALVAMSGGVDSSVTAHLLKKAGYEVTGINFTLFDSDGCGSVKESLDAKKACEYLGVPFMVQDHSCEFAREVISRFIHSYEIGETPNPCIECNRHVKFKMLLETANAQGFDVIATGHYARVRKNEESGRYELLKGIDETKDQSYVLYSLPQDVLSKLILPLGELTKKEVREIADKLGLHNAEKKDSQDICFVPDGDYGSFIERHSGKKWDCGDFVDTAGKKLGEHKGIIRYTIGQRKGLGLALPHPMFVMKKDVENNRVILCDSHELFKHEVTAKDACFVAVDKIDAPITVQAKARYSQKVQSATVTQLDENTLHVVFDEPVRAPAPGQALVLYDGERVIGGGTIV